MSRRLTLRALAKQDLADAAVWYDRRRAGLGEELLAAVKARLADVTDYPTALSIKYRTEVRQALVRRFPYALWFIASRRPWSSSASCTRAGTTAASCAASSPHG